MMKKMLRGAALLLAAAMLLLPVGCLVREEPAASNDQPAVTDAPKADAPKADRSAVAVTLGDEVITAGEIEDNYNSYMQMFSYYGMSAPTDEASINEYVDMVVEDLLTQRLPMWKAAQLGIALSSAELAAIDADAHAQADAEHTDLMLSYASYYTDAGEVQAIADLTEEQLEQTLAYLNKDVRAYYGDESADIDTYVAEAFDHYYKDALTDAYAEKLKEQMVSDLAVDDAAVDEWYERTLADQKESMDETPSMYRTMREALTLDPDETPVLYVPEGLAYVRVISLSPAGELPTELDGADEALAALEAEYGKLALNDEDEARREEIRAEYAQKKADAEGARTAYYGAAETEISALYDRLNAGEDFASVAEAASKLASDRLSVSVSDADRLIVLSGDDSEFSSAVQEAAAALSDGAYSAAVKDGDTYHIVYLVGRLAPGAADRAELSDAIRAAAVRDARESAWNDTIDAWQEEAFAAAVYHREAYAYVGR